MAAPADDETIAVAIPTRNRPSYLAALLASLAAQTYTHWMLVINDESDAPVEEHDTIKDLLTLITNSGHDVRIVHGPGGHARHQTAMEAVPGSVEFIVRIDDDMIPAPTFVQDILKPFHFFPDEPIAAVGGCFPEPHLKPLDLEFSLTAPDWIPRFDEPTWRLQGHHYDDRQIIEVETLMGGAICYRRSAVTHVGGWAVDGYSRQAHREDSDLCARLFVNGYRLLVTTEALAWHLYAPGGGARDVKKSAEGNVLVSEKGPIEEDERIFRERVTRLKAAYAGPQRSLGRFKISDLEKNRITRRPMISFTSRWQRATERLLLRRVRRLLWYFASRPKSR